MALSLNTNVDSLNAQRNLNTSQASLSTSLERLSSGLRINSAADDPAGLAIASNFTTQINGTNQAISNANFAVSEAQTAGGALSTITNNLQSIRTLAVEAANGSNSASDRAALNQQVQQQIQEITQIASQTSFNGVNVLDGSSGVTTYQVGANVGNTVSIDLAQGVRANQIGQFATQTGAAVTGTAALTSTATLSISNGTQSVTVGPSASYAGTSAYQSATSAYAKAAAINGAGLQGLTARAVTTATGAFSGITAVSTAATYDLTINGTAIYSGTGNVAVASPLTAAAVATQVNLNSQTTGVTASVNAGNITFTAADGSDIQITQTVAAGTVGGSTVTGTGIAAAISGGVGGTATTTSGQITLTDSKALTLTDAGGGVAAIGYTGLSVPLGTTTLANQDVLTVPDANNTIAAVDSALQTVSNFQSQLGAIQNRFTSAVSNLTSEAQNLTQSRGTIQDANFASETANLTQAQVLQQAGISVLAQANQEPQVILKLLQ